MQPFILHGPDFLMAVLACWLGLSLYIRAPRDQTTPVFAWFCLTLALYGLTALLPLLTDPGAPVVQHALDRGQLIATVLTPVAFFHFIAVLTTGSYRPIMRQVLLGVFYIPAVILVVYAVLAPPGAIEFGVPLTNGWFWREPRLFENPALPFWGWTVQRILPILVAFAFLWKDYLHHRADLQNRVLRRMFVIIVFIGMIGAITGITARTLRPQDVPETALIISHVLSRTLILIAMVVLAYAVLSLRLLLPPRVARRTFLYSMIGSMLTAVYVALLLFLEWLVREGLGVGDQFPIVTIFALVALVASLGPLSDWFRGELDRRFYRREFDYGRLVQTLSNDIFQRGDLKDQIQATLSAVCRALSVREGLTAVMTRHGLVVRACYGQINVAESLPEDNLPNDVQMIEHTWKPWPAARFLLPLRSGDETLGLMALGPRHSEQKFTAVEYALLDYLANYLGLAISHDRYRDEQQLALKELARQSESLQVRQKELAEALEATRQADEPTMPADGLHVHALGSLRVERNGEVITRWGGDKAGTNQAEALFAFLFDRRGKGVTKEEASEVIWPDANLEDIKRTDNSFHRTLTGLRRTLEPDLRHASKSQMIQYHHSRYWLEPQAIIWSDIEAFSLAVEQGITQFHQRNQAAALETLKQAVQLYRGDYLDDCPLFGDSPYVEEQRQTLLTRYIQAQTRLSILYESQGRMGEAQSAYQESVAAYRRMLLINPDYTTINPEEQHTRLHQYLLSETEV